MRKFLFLFVVAALLTGCSERDVSKIVVAPGFSAYVSAFTTGVVSGQSTIKVVLNGPHPEATPGSVIREELFEFEPGIEGEAYWLDDRTIEFRPNRRLPSGEHFVATFDLGEVLDVPEEFEEMQFGFIVIRQSLFVSFEGVRTLDPADFSKEELFGSVRTSDVAGPQEVQHALKASQNGRELTIDWEHDESAKTHRFTVRDVRRGDKASHVELEWTGESIGAETDGDMEIRIPPLGEFSLVQVSTMRSPGLYFSLQFSDPVDPEQDLSGLVHLQSGRALRLSVENNEIKAYPTEELGNEETVLIEQSIRNIKGTTLIESYSRVVQFNLEKPAVALLGDGVIMPSTGGISFPFKAINLKAVNLRIIRVFEQNVPQFLQVNNLNGSSELARVGRLVYDGEIDLISSEPIDYGVWNNFSIDLGSIVQPEPGAIYRVMIGYERYQSLYPCAESDVEARPLKRTQPNLDDGSAYYWGDFDWYDEGEYNWEERDDPCKDSYYMTYDRGVSANLFASDIGMIAKESADNHYDVVITDLRTTDPISGVTVEAYNYQNQKTGEGETGSDGVLRLQCQGKPYLLVARNGDQRGYLRVDNGSALSVSLYEVGGNKVEKGVKGFLYGERGVWRPGDSIFLSFMLEDKQQSLPKNHPVVLEFYDPLGKLYDKRVKTQGVEGLYAFRLKTGDDDPTGLWRARVMVGNSEFSKSLKIETVKPNRLSIHFDLGDVVSSQQAVAANLNARWLYGAPGAGLTTRAELEVENMKTEFKGFEGYQFDDRSKSFYFEDTIVAGGTTNAAGDVSLRFNWDKPDDAPGMLKMKFRTKVFEPGGDFSQDFMSVKYSPYTSYVGIKVPGGTNWISALNSEEEHAIAVAAVDEKGAPIDRSVNVEVYKMDWNWWWEGDGESELTRYINRQSAELVKSGTVQVNKGKGVYSLSFSQPDWGRYMVRVIDPVSGHSAAQEFYVEYPGWYNNSGGGNDAASMLSIETGKATFDVGEEIEVTVPSGGIGRIYVTVEKGDRILDQFWVEAASGSTTFRFEATEEMAPNVYVHAMLIQPHGQDKNSLPIRMYGVVPVYVSDPNTHLTPVISAPAVLQPEKNFQVQVSEKDGKAMAYTLAVVDEGLLSLTRHKTPDPWNTFYAKEALSVRTWDMYKYVMNAQAGKMASLLAVGGDEGLVYKEDEKANRFKPVVTYLGPFYLKKGSKNTHQVKLPNYIGAVRVMVVAGYHGAYGAAEKEIEVKQPLMVLSTLPRVLGPSERITVPVNVITMDDRIKNVNVRITANDLLQPLSPLQQSVAFAKQGEKTAFFEFEVARKLGVARFKVEVSSGKETAFEEVEVTVRPPNPVITQVEYKALAAGEQWNLDYTAFGITGTNNATLQVSRIPELDLQKQLNYLIQYPHGCIEQTTSSVFPQLYLQALTELSNEQKGKIRDNIAAGLNRLRQFQLPSGAFSYWPGGTRDPSEWGTNYAGHFMLEAKNQGYDLPAGILEQWKKFQKARASDWDRDRYDEHGQYGGDLMQAYRLYTLALAGSAEVGAMNRLRNDARLSDAAAWRLSAAYALIGREDVAKQLASRPMTVPPYREMSWTYGSDLRDMAMILESLAYLKEYDRGGDLLRDVAAGLNTGWHSTQTRAYAMLAMAKFIGGDKDGRSVAFTAEVNGKSVDINSNVAVQQFTIDKDHLKGGTVKVNNKSSQMLFVSLVQSGIPVEMNEGRARNDLQMDIHYEDMRGNAIDVSDLRQGTDFKAVVTVTHPGIRSDYKEVALSQVFPSGWQVVNTRVGDDGGAASQVYNYQDIRDDRVYTYFDLDRGHSKTFEILLNATFAGRFYKPAVLCAPMYDESIKALEPGEWVEVTANEKAEIGMAE